MNRRKDKTSALPSLGGEPPRGSQSSSTSEEPGTAALGSRSQVWRAGTSLGSSCPGAGCGGSGAGSTGPNGKWVLLGNGWMRTVLRPQIPQQEGAWSPEGQTTGMGSTPSPWQHSTWLPSLDSAPSFHSFFWSSSTLRSTSSGCTGFRHAVPSPSLETKLAARGRPGSPRTSTARGRCGATP